MTTTASLEIVLAVSAACVVYTYVLYPLLLAIVTRVRGRDLVMTGDLPRSVSVVVAAYNEEASIARRLSEFSGLIRCSPFKGEIIVVSDGSTDRTAEVARHLSCDCPVTVIDLKMNAGKAAAISRACAAARHEVIVFADTRQTWDPSALEQLVSNFRDPSVGAASGALVLESAPGMLAGVGLYWRFEKWLRGQESQLHSTVGVTGAISAVRRELFCAVPCGTLLDDVYWPLCVVMRGYRVVHDATAIAYDQLPARPRDEFRRKVRTLSGNFQLVARLPSVLLPWRNPVWLQFISHKLLRLVVPWALLLMLALSFVLPGTLYMVLFWLQAGFYAIGLASFSQAVAARLRLGSAASSFLMLNGAAWVAFWVWITGRAGQSWCKAFDAPAAGDQTA